MGGRGMGRIDSTGEREGGRERGESRREEGR